MARIAPEQRAGKFEERVRKRGRDAGRTAERTEQPEADGNVFGQIAGVERTWARRSVLATVAPERFERIAR